MNRRFLILSVGTLMMSGVVQAKDAVLYSVRVQKQLGARRGAISVECEKGAGLQCFLEKVEGPTTVWHGKVETKPIEDLVKKFFTRLPASEVAPTSSTEDVLSQVPSDAILKWEIVSEGKRSWGWVTADEFQRSVLKRELIEQLLAIETSLAGMTTR